MTTKKSTHSSKTTQPDLVPYSRAGDTFHYRWAARRCLHLLDFNSELDSITIEGSKEPSMGGEFVIDTAEYRVNGKGGKSVEYFQLKHSTVQLDKPFTLSLLEGTIEGFANRFRDLQKQTNDFVSIKFTIITNRPVSLSFKASISKISAGKSGGDKFDSTIQKYSKLSGKQLSSFCGFLNFVDDEGDYDYQKSELSRDISRLVCESNDVSQLNNLVELVRLRIEPKSKRKDIHKDDVLEQFGLTTEDDLFPARPLFEKLTRVVQRDQQESLYQSIVDSGSPFTIITAVGGTGKSIICNQLVDSFTGGSLALAYDCYGNGGYRRISAHRHRACDAYVQIVNELAKQGLCEPILPGKRDQDDRLTQVFLSRLSEAIGRLQEKNKNALLVIFFDAVDNAEMVVKESGYRSFVSHLIRETLPEGCRIVYLCRPERVKLFNPPAAVPQISIEPFSDAESLKHLQASFPDASIEDAIEFCRLTDGNPRVQANTLALGKNSVQDILAYLGVGGKTVDDLIEEQLNNAITNIKERYPSGFEQHVEDICTGLASLPPFISLKVLASASGVDISAVKSFIIDLGRPLWLTDDFVQFRDEPTETWFTSTYIANPDQIKAYITRLEPLANEFSYVAEALPSLLLKSGQYNELIKLALSEDKLPDDNPVDARKIQVYRLQFAFKAALKDRKYADACKLALRAGEEVAGSERQLEILSSNLDLAKQFLSEKRIIELAHQRSITGAWDGSETIYSASMLASIEECEGEARSYLRSGWHWLRRCFEERDKAKETEYWHHHDTVNDVDILEMASCYFHLEGYEAAVDFICSWTPDSLIYRVSSLLAARLVDLAEFDVLERMALYGKDSPSFVIALTNELMRVGRAPDQKCLTRVLNKIVGSGKWLEKPNTISSNNCINESAYLSFLEACVLRKLPLTNIRRALNYYIDAPRIYVINENWNEPRRGNYLRSIAVRAYINNNFDLSVDSVIPNFWLKDMNTYQDKEDLKKAKGVIETLLPWYMVRAMLLAGKKLSLDQLHSKAKDKSSRILSGRYQTHDPLPNEISEARFFNLALSTDCISGELKYFIDGVTSESIKFSLPDRVNALRIANRQSRLKDVSDALEESCHRLLKVFDESEGPVEHANGLVSLARAVFSASKTDAEVYFEEAIESVSRFGDEAVERWESVNSIARHCAMGKIKSPEQAHRFMRCAELIGDTVSREKHWDRDGAIETCVQLSPESAFTTASRWKDRGVGRSERMLSALLTSALETDVISPSSAWALSAVSFDYDLTSFAGICIEKERERIKKQCIFDDLVKGYRQQGVFGDTWKGVRKLAIAHDLNHEALDDLDVLIGVTKDSFPTHSSKIEVKDDESYKNYENLYGDIDFVSDAGLHQALEKFKSIDGPRDIEGLWKYAGSKLSSNNAAKYLSLIAGSESLDLYNIRYAIRFFPDNLKKKPSVQKVWPRVIKTIAGRFPDDFVRCYNREWVIRDLDIEKATLKAVQEGVTQALSDSNELESASTFYGFSGSYVAELSHEEAVDLFDFALTRFELHIDDEYAEGPWSLEFYPPEDVVKSLSGYIWANLGSPKSSERWRAVHAVRRLCEQGCDKEIDALLEWMQLGHANGFVGKSYPFYFLHAKQYLLVALSRCAMDSPLFFEKHSAVFSEIALFGVPHIFIQKYAAEIALAIDRVKPKTYSELEIQALEQIGKSPFPIKMSDKLYEKVSSLWHEQGLIDTSIDFSFSYDFDSYWFEPLGGVFQVSSNQVQELTAEVIVKDWNLAFSDGYVRDPRQELWNVGRDRDTWHSHSNYPRTDGYKFYLSYHAMLTVASKLLVNMPIVHSSQWREDEWQDWLNRHLLTQSNNLWLSDLRGNVPIQRREWLSENDNEAWRWSIQAKDFLEVLLVERLGTTWLNIAGGWNEYKNGRNENLRIRSMLVSSEISSSLLHAINNYTDHNHDCKSLTEFVEYDHFDEGGANHIFKLKEWVLRGDSEESLDKYDPYAGDIDYPEYELDETIAQEIGLIYDQDKRLWYSENGDEVLLRNQVWSEDKPVYQDNDYCCKGNRMQASLGLLTSVCHRLESDLMIQVSIDRHYTSEHRNKDDGLGYIPSYKKVYILSKDGRLRDSRRSFKLRETVS